MKYFKHINARTGNEAIKLLKGYKGRAKLIAGGTDLLGVLKDKILPDYPEALINIKTVPGLDHIKEDTRGLKIGAMARLADIAELPVVKEKYKLLAEAAEAVATPGIRNIGTIGGNLCQEPRCWYYRYPHHTGGRILCYLKGGKSCYALTGENRYHSIMGGCRVASPPCSAGCPGNVEIASYMSLIREDNISEAARILLSANPMPAITGRVCPHNCETECNRRDLDESVSVRAVERFLGDYILDHSAEFIKPPAKDTGKKVAIVGSGPAGLSAAYYLRRVGYKVTVFDRMAEAGGMLTFGIPAYRLPKETVRQVVNSLKDMGIEFKLKVDIGKDITIESLRKTFDAVLLGAGSWKQRNIGLEGENLTKSGIEFLINTNLGLKQAPGMKVLVIGGGNVAVDVSITALRLGAKDVTLACLERREEMPAFSSEIEQAIEEGVHVMPCWGPDKVLTSGGKVKGMDLISCTSVFDCNGSFAPCYDSGTKTSVEADVIFTAIGQAADLSFLGPESPLKIDRGLLVSDKNTMETCWPGVYAGGEVTSGPSSVIGAITAGRKAALAIDQHLVGVREAENIEKSTTEPFVKFNVEYLKKTGRAEAQNIPIAKRSLEAEDVPGLSKNEIEVEANRCLNCGCMSVYSSDIGVALVALSATIKIAGSKGIRTIPIEDFFSSFRNVLEADDMITEIYVPRPPEKARQTYLKFRMRKAIDFPVVSVASVFTVDDGVCKNARIVLGAVAPRPVRATATEQKIKGKDIGVLNLEAAAEAALVGAMPLGMNKYKIQITKTLVKRALMDQP